MWLITLSDIHMKTSRNTHYSSGYGPFPCRRHHTDQLTLQTTNETQTDFLPSDKILALHFSFRNKAHYRSFHLSLPFLLPFPLSSTFHCCSVQTVRWHQFYMLLPFLTVLLNAVSLSSSESCCRTSSSRSHVKELKCPCVTEEKIRNVDLSSSQKF
jgi:hypothetical protein